MNVRALAITLLISFALYFTYGQFSLPWMAVLPVIFALSICALPTPRFFARHADVLSLILILFFLAVSSLSLLPSSVFFRSMIVDVANQNYLSTMQLFFIAAGAFVIGLFFASRLGGKRLQLALFCAVVASIIGAFVLIIPTSPRAQIDVWTVQEEGAQAFVDFKNPYKFEYTNIYSEELRPILTPGGVTYSYLPGTFMWMAPWKAAGLDTRYSQILTRLLTTLLLLLIAWKALGALRFQTFVASLLFLSFPLQTFFIVRAWNDDISIMCYALAAWALVTRRPWALFVACNFLLVLKHHAIFFVPLIIWFAWRLFGEKLWKTILKSTAVAAGILSAYLIADWRNFLGSLYGLTFLKFPNVHQVFPDRRDPFSLMNYLHLFVGYKNGWLFVFAVVAIAGLIMKRLWREPLVPPFLRGLAAMAFAMFIFSPIAFANYYGFAWALMIIAFAASQTATTVEPATSARETNWEIKTDWWPIAYVATRAVILFCFSELIIETRYFHSVADMISAERWPYLDFGFNFLPFALIPAEIPKLLQDAGAQPGFLTYHTLFQLIVLAFDIFIATSLFSRFREGKLSRAALLIFIFGPLFLAPLYLTSAAVVTIAFAMLAMKLLSRTRAASSIHQKTQSRPRTSFLAVIGLALFIPGALWLASEFFDIELNYDQFISPTGFLIWATAFAPLALSLGSRARMSWVTYALSISFLIALSLTFYLLWMIEAVVDQRNGFAQLIFARNILIAAAAALYIYEIYRANVSRDNFRGAA